MNICFFHHSAIDPRTGGIKRVTACLGDELTARGHTVRYLARSAAPDVIYDSSRQFFLSDFLSIDDFFEKNPTDVFVFQDGDDCKIFDKNVFAARGIPLLCCIHNDPELFRGKMYVRFLRNFGKALTRLLFPIVKFQTFWAGRKFIKIFRENYSIADMTILLSDRFIAPFSSLVREKGNHEKIRAIGNPAPFSCANADLAGKRKELLFVGRMENGQKCMDFLLKIWARLENRFPEWSLRFVGNGKDSDFCKELVARLSLNRVFFEGRQNPEKYYQSAAIFCMTSAYEGFPMVLVEAAAFGCVPVAFDSFAAVHDIIADGENGRIVPAFDLDKYAETLAELMSDDALRERLAQNALHIAEKFSPEKIGAAWEKLLAEKGR